ncbi:hypothetical protein QCA50_010328 [Cerrena zonata]|uniref:2,5-diamino-6-ribosylamino-4(3H)-pyrimidinone 5'-phosphate reductase n=1 Tax=Cerrena zonata TaxID=2478898 RepID=A0AAW0G057_9APHY
MELLSPPAFLMRTLLPGYNRFLGAQVSLYDPESESDEELKPPTPVSPDPSKPYVTLAFAQSLDAKIAGPNGKQLTLSSQDSMIMTHWMRTMHDAIMVGIGTALNDNPQLNARLLPSSLQQPNLPRPIILDTNLRLPLDCKLLKNFQEKKGRRPWVIGYDTQETGWQDRKKALETTGAKVIEVKSENGQIYIPDLLQTLRSLGIRSLMVEGGARVIKSFLAESNAVNTIIITIAPKFVGSEGVGYGSDLTSSQALKFEHARTELFNRDAVMALKVLG